MPRRPPPRRLRRKLLSNATIAARAFDTALVSSGYGAYKAGRGAYGAVRKGYGGLKKRLTAAYKRRNNKINRLIKTEGTGSSFSVFKKVYKAYPMYRKLCMNTEKQLYEFSNSFVLTGNIGQQGVFSSSVMYQSDMQTLANKIQGLLSTNGTVYNLNAVQGTLGTTGGIVNTMRFGIKEISQKFWITNNTTANTYLDIYHLVARDDNDVSPIVTWDRGVQDSTSGATSIGSNKLYMTPFASPLFCQYFKIDKVHHIEMAQGRTHIETVKYFPHNVVEMERFNNGIYIKGLTRIVMMVAYGSPANDIVNTNNVSTTSVKLDVTQDVKYTYTFNTIPTKSFTYNNTIATVTTASIIDEGSGLVASEATA
jgi:hypothetical protein